MKMLLSAASKTAIAQDRIAVRLKATAELPMYPCNKKVITDTYTDSHSVRLPTWSVPFHPKSLAACEI